MTVRGMVKRCAVCLENRCALRGAPWVQIPPPPLSVSLGYQPMGANGLDMTAQLPASATLRYGPSQHVRGKAQREVREMIRKHFRFKRFVLGLALGFVFTAIAVPAALAKPVSSDTLNGGFDPWAYSLVHQSTQPSSSAVTAIRVSSSPSGFDWKDAGVGAGVSFGAVLILVGSVGFG